MSSRDEIYRMAAQVVAERVNAFLADGIRLIVEPHGAIHPMNTKDRDDAGEGAFVDARIWIPGE